MTRTWRYAALACAVAAAALGCATEDASSPPPPGASSPAEADAVVVRFRIANGSVSPVNERREAKIGQPIELVVDSDAEDELHVHATPEHTFTVRPEAGQRFQFTVDVPGRVEIELHRAHKTVATVVVRP
ncbi:hypothetical protein SAMN04244553_1558 [Nocardia amikacinitolerans]|uniref:Cupredoxin-like domain-containing protein n=1 Tax=Nocardia amikacinitolerans TaxID=756689 RepID=A0A285L6N3_9NOCA|nr:hypothetical protein [Nocardia amikacinitolerans]MCP2297678.1 hypothetical protein [Nocardia amikacinitolerans]SNY79286.1 hypothetical protein SAMN04244553_1558 [Nocardia amikacinitolerans]